MALWGAWPKRRRFVPAIRGQDVKAFARNPCRRSRFGDAARYAAAPRARQLAELVGRHYWDGGFVSNTPLQWIAMTRAEKTLVPQWAQMAHGLRRPHHRRQTPRSQSLPLQGRRRHQALGRPWRDRRQSSQHGPRQAGRTIALIPQSRPTRSAPPPAGRIGTGSRGPVRTFGPSIIAARPVSVPSARLTSDQDKAA